MIASIMVLFIVSVIAILEKEFRANGIHSTELSKGTIQYHFRKRNSFR